MVVVFLVVLRFVCLFSLLGLACFPWSAFASLHAFVPSLTGAQRTDSSSASKKNSAARGYHWRNISEARPQAKGIERAVCIMKEGIYANWLALERHCNARIALESPLLGYLVGHVYRTYNAFCEGKAGSTPLGRLFGLPVHCGQ